MRVTARDLDSVPPGNICVPRDQFGVLWSRAEQRSSEQGDRGVTDWSAGGVVITCRWLAGAMTESATGHRRLSAAPITRTRRLAYEELIEAEFVAAEILAARQPAPVAVLSRPGYVDAVRQTLGWAWRGDRPCPVLDPACAAGS